MIATDKPTECRNVRRAEPISLCPCNKYDSAPQKVVSLYAPSQRTRKKSRRLSPATWLVNRGGLSPATRLVLRKGERREVNSEMW